MNMYKIITGIDLDGVIAGFTELAIENVKKEFHIDVTYEEMYIPNIGKIVWDKMSDKEKNGYNNYQELYARICPAGFFSYLKPIGNSVQSVKNLYSAGCRIVFITKPMDWQYSTNEKYEWLKRYFKDIEYSVVMVDSMQAKKLFDVDVLVDDDAYALMKLAPYNRICIKTPWNKEYREKGYEGISVNNFDEAAEFIINNLDFYSQKDKEGLDAPKSN